MAEHEEQDDTVAHYSDRPRLAVITAGAIAALVVIARTNEPMVQKNTHESARNLVETLPRYEEPPSYKSNNSF
jgi:hypothetical protein